MENSLAIWQPDIQSTYGNVSESTSYIRELQGPLRPKYPNDMAQKELMTSLIQVWLDIHEAEFHTILIQGERYYNAFKKDIAVVNIYFGDSTVFGKSISSKFGWIVWLYPGGNRYRAPFGAKKTHLAFINFSQGSRYFYSEFSALLFIFHSFFLHYKKR